MTVAKPARSGMPLTLRHAHEKLVRIRPCRTASLESWLSYYRHSVTVYEHVVQTDSGHECEALYWAQRERIHAQETEAQMRAQIPDG